MENMFKKKFFSNLMTALIIISNLIGYKYTNFGGLILSVNFVTLPFVYLCFLLLSNISDKKDAWSSILVSILIQILVVLAYFFAINLESQNIIFDLSRYVNVLFKINFLSLIVNIGTLTLSIYVLDYIYEYFRVIRYRLLGTVISVLSALILYGLICIPILNYKFGFTIILDMIMGHLIMSVIMTIMVSVVFYLLKEKEYPYEVNKIFINDLNISIPKDKIDKPIEEVIKLSDKKNEEDKKKNRIRPKNKKNSSNSSKNYTKKYNNGKKAVKK